MIRIIHLADIHYCQANQEKALASLRTAWNVGSEKGVDLWAIAGDLFESSVKNTERDGFPELVDIITEMLNLAPVAAVYGTVTHDIPGCYEVFTRIEAKHNFAIVQPGQAYFLISPTYTYSYVSTDMAYINSNNRLLILGCPEPQKQWFLQNKSLSKDEANQAITQGMRKILLGMGAVRKQHADLPCLFLYHGNVTGSKMCNGQVVKSGIDIGKDDLRMIDPNIEAHYAGSGYPVNWGELDQKSFNYITLGVGQTYGALGHIHLAQQMTGNGVINMRVWNYPHAPMKKITLQIGDSVPDMPWKGFQSWLELKGTKEQLAEFDQEKWKKILEVEGALPGSKVTTTLIHEETVRTAGIQEAERLRDKVKIYHDNSADNTVNIKSVMQKADIIESEARKAGVVSEGLWFRLKKIRLRGAIGIHKGIGKEEIVVDFNSMDPGLVALVGRNGTGKTTLLENLHVFPCMLTRSGKLQNHFQLRDSAREIWGIDERTNDEYRVLMNIDGKNKSGDVECFLFKNGKSITNGKKSRGEDCYDNVITRVFGSLELFRRSAFVTQKNNKNNPCLEDATKGEKKALFTELAGIDYLQTYSDMAKQRAEIIENGIEKDELKIVFLKTNQNELEKTKNKQREKSIERDYKYTQISDLEKTGKVLAEQKAQIDKVVARNQVIEAEIKNAGKNLVDKQKTKNDIENEIKELREALEKKGEAEKIVKEYENLQAQEKQLMSEKTRILEQKQQEMLDFQKKTNNYIKQLQHLEDLRKTYENNVEKNDIEVKNLKEKLGQKVQCPECKCIFYPVKNDGEIKEEIIRLEAENAKMIHEIQGIDDSVVMLKVPAEPEYAVFDGAKLIKTGTALINGIEGFNQSRNILAKAENAQEQIAKKSSQVRKIQDEIADINANTEKLTAEYNTAAKEEAEKIQKKLDKTRSDYTQSKADLAGLEAELKTLNSSIEILEKNISEAKTLEQKVKEAKRETTEWRYLQKACGSDGIQALELDALAPGICHYINLLLPQNPELNRYTQARIDTTRTAGTGSKTHQVEDFAIKFLDSIHRDWVDLSDLSGGEARWAVQSVADAFGIIRKNNTGVKFLTCFKDEADGALDPEAKAAYLCMLEAAHQESGRYHTILITHSREIQEMIEQKIVMTELEEIAAEKEEVTA